MGFFPGFHKRQRENGSGGGGGGADGQSETETDHSTRVAAVKHSKTAEMGIDTGASPISMYAIMLSIISSF